MTQHACHRLSAFAGKSLTLDFFTRGMLSCGFFCLDRFRFSFVHGFAGELFGKTGFHFWLGGVSQQGLLDDAFPDARLCERCCGVFLAEEVAFATVFLNFFIDDGEVLRGCLALFVLDGERRALENGVAPFDE